MASALNDHSEDDQDLLVALAAAFNCRHHDARAHREDMRGGVVRSARLTVTPRRINGGAAAQMGDVINRRAFGQTPGLVGLTRLDFLLLGLM